MPHKVDFLDALTIRKYIHMINAQQFLFRVCIEHVKADTIRVSRRFTQLISDCKLDIDFKAFIILLQHPYKFQD